MAPKRESRPASAPAATKKAKSSAQGRVSSSFKAKAPSSASTGKGAKKAAVSAAPLASQKGPTLIINDSQWDGAVKEARKAMGGKAAIHGDVNGVNRIDDVLRVFDLSYKYGPATGLTRLERWSRAEELGLEPPVEVKDILLTREGLTDERYRDSFATVAGV